MRFTVPLAPPLGPAYLARSLRREGHTVQIVDAVGEAPMRVTPIPGQPVVLCGLPPESLVERVARRHPYE